ncbi:MAG: uroporphyrinogen decarboxylase family protein [Deltaproteobacteria bacterium]|nr:uroporphyrinogen decarboxylase family protein [Deltaproteobacteria bacterium]
MTSLERVQAALAFSPSDRPPVIGQVFGHAATTAGIPLEDYLQDGELLARGQLAALARYGYDAVFALMDVDVEAQALGSRLSFRPGGYPVVESPALAGGVNLDLLRPPHPERDGRMPELLRAARRLRREVGDEVLVVGCVLGPLTLALQLLGVEPALYLAVDDPATFGRLLDFTTQVALDFGRAQIAAGAHLPLLFDPSASPSLVPPQFFREFEAPRLTRLCQAFRAAGALANWLHITGPATPLLTHYPAIGADIVNLDYLMDPAEAMSLLPHTCLDGNLKPLSFVLGQPEEIHAEARRLLALFRDRGGYILAPGCELPPESRPENILALVAAAAEAP